MVAALIVAAAMALARRRTRPAATPTRQATTAPCKVDRVPFDDHPDNQPHVGCVFQIDFYGFDQGDLNAEVTFEAQPPTLRRGTSAKCCSRHGVHRPRTTTPAVERGGPRRLGDLHTGLHRHHPHERPGLPRQADRPRRRLLGADTKYRCFWVDGCGPGQSTTTTTSGAQRPRPRAATTTSHGGHHQRRWAGRPPRRLAARSVRRVPRWAAAPARPRPVGGGGGGLPFTGSERRGAACPPASASSAIGRGDAASACSAARRPLTPR
jgi:hypothetical protein